jgi:hypothetical protein
LRGTLSHLIAASAYAGAALLFGVLLGERGELGAVQQLFRAVIPIATVALTVVSRQGRLQVAATGVAMLAGLLLGQQQFARAWDDCTQRAPIVRDALFDWHVRTGSYPSRLEELPLGIPCRGGFRGTILHYLSNERGFRLSYGDDRRLVVATDRTPFTASGKSSAPPPK